MAEHRSAYTCQDSEKISVNTPSIIFVCHTESKQFVLKYLNVMLSTEHM